jgi:YidC/Oxa1 family membrane protein insertase
VDKRTLLFFILLGLILVLWPLYNAWINRGRVPVTPPEEEQVQPETAAVPETVRIAEPVAEALPETLRISPGGAGVPERIVTVDTDLYTAKLSTRGGRLVSFTLKQYEQAPDHLVEMIPPGRSVGVLTFGVSELDLLPFTVDVDSLSLDSRNKAGDMKFTFSGTSGKTLVKTFRFSNDRYSLSLRIDCDDPAYFGLSKSYRLTWGGPPPLTEKNIGEDLAQTKAYASFGGELLDFKKFKDGELEEERTGSTSWVALRSKYFAAAVAPKTRSGEGFSVSGREVPTVVEEKNYKLREIGVAITVPIEEQTISDEFLVYVGPLDYHLLKNFGLGLENLVELGWKIIKPFSILVLWVLAFLHKFLPNYGLVIIIFSILIKLLFHPLTQKSVKSMTRMQELQPRLAKLKERYKKDPKRLNEETMKLYKEAGVNPLGGCLPLLLQMPLFYALFVILRSTIELRSAPFMLWINDLSQMDPYYVLPILMGLTMFIQQKISVKDPRQKMMVYLMPGIFVFFFYRMPAGLVLYWTMFNVLSVVEQLYIKKKHPPAALPVTTEK